MGESGYMTERERLQRESYECGEIIKAIAFGLKFARLSDAERKVLRRQVALETAARDRLQERLALLSD
jgi:hypothetical protein